MMSSASSFRVWVESPTRLNWMFFCSPPIPPWRPMPRFARADFGISLRMSSSIFLVASGVSTSASTWVNAQPCSL